ncbi:MAG: 3-deoxy-8-phosphooctulonate synthase [Bradymonadia bacterium]
MTRPCAVTALQNGTNEEPLVVIAGVNVLEDLSHTETVMATLNAHTQRLGMPFVFKASFDKANRSDHRSYRGPGLDEGLSQLKSLKAKYQCSIVTDVHEVNQVEQVAEVADVIQIPAFLSRQTDLLREVAQTQRCVLLKKMQMMSPLDVLQAREKCLALGAKSVVVCERGTSFGYQNLVLDFHGLLTIKKGGAPLVVDISHALQQPGALGSRTGGRGSALRDIGKAAVAMGLTGVFFECHVQPELAQCDGPCALPLAQAGEFLTQLAQVDALVKSFSSVD